MLCQKCKFLVTVDFGAQISCKSARFCDKVDKQVGAAKLCQTQVKLEVIVEAGIEFGVEVEACHY